MPSISVGQADNLLSAGKVAIPSYPKNSQYPCVYPDLDFSKVPQPIPLGSYDSLYPPPKQYRPLDDLSIRNRTETCNNFYETRSPYEKPQPELEAEISRELYEGPSQHADAGEFSDKTILIISLVLFALLLLCTFATFRMSKD